MPTGKVYTNVAELWSSGDPYNSTVPNTTDQNFVSCDFPEKNIHLFNHKDRSERFLK